jgi:hypothetical protein
VHHLDAMERTGPGDDDVTELKRLPGHLTENARPD